MTFDEFFKQAVGRGIDFDGNYGVQCFDLANEYCVKVLGGRDFIGMYAYEIYTNFNNQPSRKLFTRIPNTPDFVPKKGDIIVWAKSLNNRAGHVAVCTGEGNTFYFYSYDQNWSGRNDFCTKIRHSYAHVLGVLRPKDQTKVLGTPPILDTEGYRKGDKNLGVYAVKQRLISLGHTGLDDTFGFGSGTESAVNAELKKHGYKPNGIAGKKFIKLIMK